MNAAVTNEDMEAGLIVSSTSMNMISFGSTVRVQFTTTPGGSIHVSVSAAPSASLYDMGRSRKFADEFVRRWNSARDGA